MSPSITIRQITDFTDADLETATRIFSEAFAKDPLHNISTGNHPELLARSEAHGALIGGEFYFAEIDGTVVGAAGWFPPGKALFDSQEQMEKAGEPFMIQLEPEVKKWWEENFLPTYAASADKIFTPGFKLGSYHLQSIGVLAKYQRRGIAQKLIEHVRVKAHAQGIPLCLEAITQINSVIYEKLGFKFLDKIDFKGPGNAGDFTFYLMSCSP